MLNWSLWLGLYLCFLWWHGAFAQPLSLKRSIVYATSFMSLNQIKSVEAYKAQLANDKGSSNFHGQYHQIL
jgi:hypothetical protein